MLVYEKWVTESNEKVRHLYGTVGNVPNDSDNQLVYQDKDGDAVTPTLAYTYLDDGHGGIKMVDSEGAETFLAVNIKKQDNSLVNIIPGGTYQPAAKVLSSIAFTKQPNTMTYTVGDSLVSTGSQITATWSSGETSKVTTSCTFKFNVSNSTTCTADDTAIVASYTYPAEGDNQVTKTATSNAITVNPAQNEQQPEG